MGRALFCLLVLMLVLAWLPGAAGAEIYRYLDAAGGVHFTPDLRDVPPDQREDALRRAREREPARFQTFKPESSQPASAAPAALVPASGPLQIPFQRRGTLMVVEAVLNDHVRAPFLVDTGASGIAIPRSVSDALGFRIGSDTPRVEVQTANGIISEPLVPLESVHLGGARVEGLDAIVSSTMEVGLLGGAFFNNFVYEIDAAAGRIRLRPNDAIRGGLAEDDWRARFEVFRRALEELDRELQSTDSAASTRRERLLDERAALEAAQHELERLAQDAQVPGAWRQ